jgi:hypothetical protein
MNPIPDRRSLLVYGRGANSPNNLFNKTVLSLEILISLYGSSAWQCSPSYVVMKPGSFLQRRLDGHLPKSGPGQFGE